MKAPRFWQANQSLLLPTLLSPIAKIWEAETRRRLKKQGYKSSIPVVCIGNITVGGSGKTPTAIKLAQYYLAKGLKPVFLSRGYGANIKQPTKVDVLKHSYKEVGDEPLLLSQYAEAWVSPNRADGAKAIAKDSQADIIIMDDGMQNPSLHKDMNILIIDGGFGLGNQKILPAGPLRESLSDNLKRTDVAIILGDDRYNIANQLSCKTFKANVIAKSEHINKNETYWAFCGLGRPSKFYESLEAEHIKVKTTTDFSDHHPYSEKDITDLIDAATLNNCQLITTEKDKMRIPQHLREQIAYLPITLDIDFNAIFAD
ncbi:MAG: tetraacyldisaccharide 4'-kinase [Alphaproteobacteria bacterium]